MAGYAQCQATGEHGFIVLTAHFSSVKNKPRAIASTNAAEGIFMVEFSTLTWKVMSNTRSLFNVFMF